MKIIKLIVLFIILAGIMFALKTYEKRTAKFADISPAHLVPVKQEVVYNAGGNK